MLFCDTMEQHLSPQTTANIRLFGLSWFQSNISSKNNKYDEPTMINTKSNNNLNNNRCKEEMYNINRPQISTCLIRTTTTSEAKISSLRHNQEDSLISPSSSKAKHKTKKTKTNSRRRQRQTMTKPVPIKSIFCYLSNLLAIWFLVLNCICRMPVMVESARLPDIYWNSSNPIFRIDNTDHIFDVNKKQDAHDQVDIVCPSSTSSSSSLSANSDPAGIESSNNETSNSQERYIIYSVSKEEYDTCRLNSSPARVVAVCDQQANGKNRPPFTVTFRSFTPQPNGLEFKAGQDYYFISALFDHHHNDQHKRFSPCREQNMKVIFKVCCKSSSSQSSSPPTPSSLASGAALNGAGTSSASQQQQQQVSPVNSRPNLSSLLPPNNVPQRSVPVQTAASTKRPSVITLRPSLPQQREREREQQTSSASSQQTANKHSMLDDYLRTLTPNFNPSNNQPQAFTVLPIEVLQPSSSETPFEAMPSISSSTTTTTTTTTRAPQLMQDQMLREHNDIVLNEQPPTSIPSFNTKHNNNNNRNPALFFPFDPTAPPEILRERWTPTPLPPNLTSQKHHHNQLSPSQSSSSSSSYLSMHHAPLFRPTSQPLGSGPLAGNQRQPQYHNQQQPPMVVNPYQLSQLGHPSQRDAPSSRIKLYPPSFWNQYEPSKDSMITIPDQQPQPSSGSSRVSSLAALVPCLLVLALLALYLNHRTKRAQIASIR